MKEFVITINEDGIPEQWFNGKKYKCYKGRRYFTQHKWAMHRVVWEHYNGSIPVDFEIHHIDENPHNNTIENLELVKKGEHQRMHNLTRDFTNFQRAGTERAKEWHKSEEGRLWHMEHGKNSWKTREKITKKCLQCDKEYETYIGVVSKYCHQNCKAKYNRRKRKEATEI